MLYTAILTDSVTGKMALKQQSMQSVLLPRLTIFCCLVR